MKNNLFKSFRVEIILYGLLSLFYTLLTETVLYVILCLFKHLFHKVWNNPISFRELSRNYQIKRPLQGTSNSISDRLDVNNQIGLETFRMTPNVGIIILMGILVGIIIFIMYFLLLTKKFATYLEEIARGVNNISSGDFTTRIEIKDENEFALIAGRLNKMADDISKIMENDRKNENTKNEMIASVAHDLRTPLTSIIGYLQLVSTDKNLDKEKTQKYVGVAYEKSIRLEKLIEDLFTYTKFSFGEVTMKQTKVDLVKFINQLADEFYPAFQECNLEYEFYTSHKSIIVMADGDLLARAFANLISNAVKYGSDGKCIKIRLEKKSEQVHISIINYGELIPEKDLDNIFDKFFRVESSRSNETGGTGLGLAIAKSIILMHEGQLWAKSDFEGTVFEVTLNLMKDSIL